MSRCVIVGVVLLVFAGGIVSAEILEGTPYMLAGLNDLATHPAKRTALCCFALCLSRNSVHFRFNR